MNLHIQPCADAREIAPILKVLRHSVADDPFEQRLTQALQNGYRVLLAQREDLVTGCLGYHITHDVFWGKSLYVDDLVVRPETRGMGVGAKLMDAAKSEARAQNCDYIRLCSGLDRHDAHRFYAQNNFRKSSLQFAYAVPDGAA